MAKEFLWAGSDSDLTYPGNDGNVQLAAGQRGTFLAWVNSGWDGLHMSDLGGTLARIFTAYIDSAHYVCLQCRAGTTMLRVKIASTNTTSVDYALDATIWPADTWRLVGFTWDFSGGLNAGIVRLYLDGAEVGTAVTTANGLAAAPTTISVGGKANTEGVNARTGFHGYLDNAAIWSGAMTAPQMLVLFNAGRRHPIVQADGTGTLLFLATYDGTYNADIHAGTATATITTAAQSGRLPDGRAMLTEYDRCVRSRLHFGTGTDRARISGHSVWGRPHATTWDQPTDAADHCYWTTAATASYLELRNCPNWEQPCKFTMRLVISGLAAAPDEYILVGPYNSPVRVYSNRIVDNGYLPWVSGTGYTANTSIVFGKAAGAYTGHTYRCSASHTAAAANEPGVGATWAEKWAECDVSIRLPVEVGSVDGMDDGYPAPGSPTRNDKWVDLSFHTVFGGVAATSYFAVNYDRGGPFVKRASDWTYSGYPFAIRAAAAHMPTSTVTVKIEWIEIEGPTDYQLNDTPFCDFLGSWDGARWTGKVWRGQGVERIMATPVLYAGNPVMDETDLTGWNEIINAFAQTWPHVEANGNALRMWWAGRMTANPVTGNNLRLFDSADGITWTADPANPILDFDAVRGVNGDPDFGFNFGVVGCRGMFRDPDGRAILVYDMGDDWDGYNVRILRGGVATTEYTFTAAMKYPRNPIIGPWGQVENGAQNFHNRDNHGMIWKNPFPKADGSDAYLYAGNAKSFYNSAPFSYVLRVPVTMQSRDGYVWEPLHAGARKPLPAYTLGESGRGLQVARDRLLYFSFGAYADGLRLIFSEDGKIYQDAIVGAVPAGGQAWDTGIPYANYRVVGIARLGDDLKLYYAVNIDDHHGGIGMATLGWNRVAKVSLLAGQTSGTVVSSAFTKPANGWGPLLLNADTQAGTITVGVFDGTTGAAIAGYAAGNMDAWTGDHGGDGQEVTWGGLSLSALTNASLILVFYLGRANAALASPRLHAYNAEPDPLPLVEGGAL